MLEMQVNILKILKNTNISNQILYNLIVHLPPQIMIQELYKRYVDHCRIIVSDKSAFKHAYYTL